MLQAASIPIWKRRSWESAMQTLSRRNWRAEEERKEEKEKEITKQTQEKGESWSNVRGKCIRPLSQKFKKKEY